MGAGLRFGICTDQNMPWALTVERWKYFEALGFDSIWNCDHLIQPSNPTGPYFEGWTQLAGLAAVTEKIRIGVLVSSNTFRHPSLLAKEVATVDHISNGRLEVGIGAGWYQPEHEAYGLDFPAPGELVGRFREAVEIVDRLLRADNDTLTTYEGQYYQLKDAPFRPGPVQRPRPPFMLGAKKQKMLRIAAEYADTWNSSGSVEDLRVRNEMLNEQCAIVGRDPSTVRRSLYGWASRLQGDFWESVDSFHDMVGQYREAGVQEFIIDQPRAEQFPVLERIVAEVLPALR